VPSAHWYARGPNCCAIAAEVVLIADAPGSWRGHYFLYDMNTENEMILTLAVTDRTLSGAHTRINPGLLTTRGLCRWSLVSLVVCATRW
jgi:hypothetical protein